jgi:hypothetical protein
VRYTCDAGRRPQRDGNGFLDTIQLDALPGELVDEPIVGPRWRSCSAWPSAPPPIITRPISGIRADRKELPGWNWAAPWIPTVWAFYHKLWIAGLAFALWPVAAMEVFGLVDPYLGDSTFVRSPARSCCCG